MGIRDTSYYGWEDVQVRSPTRDFLTGSYYGLDVDVSGNIYACGQELNLAGTGSWIVDKSTDGGRTWSNVDTVFVDAVHFTAHNVKIDPTTDDVYVVGISASFGSADPRLQLRKSTDYGKTWSFVSSIIAHTDTAYADLTISPGGTIYALNAAVGTPLSVISSSDDGSTWGYQAFGALDAPLDAGITAGADNVVYFCAGNEIYSSSDDGDTWGSIKPSQPPTYQYYGIAVDSSNTIFVGGSTDETLSGRLTGTLIIQSSSDGGATWGTHFHATASYSALEIDVDSNDNVYVAGFYYKSPSNNPTWLVRGSFDSGVLWSTVDTFSTGRPNNIVIDDNDVIYTVGRKAGKDAIVRQGKLTANSASLGPKMLATSFGYVASELSGAVNEKFKLNNISEFPHSSGLFQMKNLVLGTTDSGKIGKGDDSLIQVRHFGSTVRIFWPRQDTTVAEVPIKGFGDFSIGQRAGKLTTAFDAGDNHDVTKHDHLALYCYLRKEVSGTLDDVEIRIERRPLRSTGFAVEQSIEYETSGSITVAKLKDMVYKKEIDYGDLSMREIGFPIDIPLSNVKEVRISCKHTNGQADEENLNLIIWGRMISSKEET